MNWIIGDDDVSPSVKVVGEDLKTEDALKVYTIDDKIRLAQEELKRCTEDGNFFTSNSVYGGMKNIDKEVSRNVKRSTDKGLLACTRKFNAKLYGKRGKPKPPGHLPELKWQKQLGR